MSVRVSDIKGKSIVHAEICDRDMFTGLVLTLNDSTRIVVGERSGIGLDGEWGSWLEMTFDGKDMLKGEGGLHKAKLAYVVIGQEIGSCWCNNCKHLFPNERPDDLHEKVCPGCGARLVFGDTVSSDFVEVDTGRF